ncbi:MAG: aminoglycoside phosphotransferase family protein [Acidimicrobiia bacterium]|nr:aminoglycoside phosphotransferase family protein [Acidimicrobiia bacterium]
MPRQQDGGRPASGERAGERDATPEWWIASLVRLASERFGLTARPVAVEANASESRWRSGLLDIECDGELLSLFWKVGNRSSRDRVGRADGVGYEAAVYEHALSHLGIGVAPLFGVVHDGEEVCLAIARLDRPLKASMAPQPESLRSAVRTLASIHARAEAVVAGGPEGLQPFDAWRSRDWLSSAIDLHGTEAFEDIGIHRILEVFDELAAGPWTLVHGDCYPANVLVTQGVPVFVDWETAGIGPGELDLAALTERWPDDVVADCLDRYCSERWGGPARRSVVRRLAAARCFLYVRWLGGSPSLRRPSATEDAFRRLARVTGTLAPR